MIDVIVTGAIFIDLTTVREDRQRGRVAAALGDAPDGADVELHVGPLIVGADVLRVIRDYAQQHGLSVRVTGEARAVGAWVIAIRTGEVCGMLLL